MIISIFFNSVCYTILTIWIILTILYQHKYLRKILLKFIHNDFHLIPVWTLFAPNPISRDFYIVYRDYYQDKTISELKLLQVNYIPILHERYDKATLTMIFNILKVLKNHNDVEVVAKIPEFKKLKYILKKVDYTPTIVNRQFSIVDMAQIDNSSKFTPIITFNIVY